MASRFCPVAAYGIKPRQYHVLSVLRCEIKGVYVLQENVVLSTFAMLVYAVLLAAVVCIGGGSWTSPALTLPATPQLPECDYDGRVETDDGSSIWYARFGHGHNRNGTVITFLHGGLANSNYWSEQIRHLVSQGYECLAIDSRGHGRSVEALASNITYHKMTRDVLQVMDHLQIGQTVIVGWSDGANIGLDMAMHFHSRLRGIFAFGATYSPANSNLTISTNPIFCEYLARSEAEFRALNPRPHHLPVFEGKVQEMWSTLPNWTEHSFQAITPLSNGGPLVWIVDGGEEEAVNRNVARQLFNWVCWSLLSSGVRSRADFFAEKIPNSGLAILPMVSHFA